MRKYFSSEGHTVSVRVYVYNDRSTDMIVVSGDSSSLSRAAERIQNDSSPG